jgi:hypothetical protein
MFLTLIVGMVKIYARVLLRFKVIAISPAKSSPAPKGWAKQGIFDRIAAQEYNIAVYGKVFYSLK